MIESLFTSILKGLFAMVLSLAAIVAGALVFCISAVVWLWMSFRKILRYLKFVIEGRPFAPAGKQ